MRSRRRSRYLLSTCVHRTFDNAQPLDTKNSTGYDIGVGGDPVSDTQQDEERVAARLPGALARRLERCAERDQRTVSSAIRKAIEGYCDTIEREQ